MDNRYLMADVARKVGDLDNLEGSCIIAHPTPLPFGDEPLVYQTLKHADATDRLVDRHLHLEQPPSMLAETFANAKTGIRNREGNLYIWPPSNANIDELVSYWCTQPQAECTNRLPHFCPNYLPHRGYQFYVPVFRPRPYTLVPTAFFCKHRATSPSSMEKPQPHRHCAWIASPWDGVASLTRCK